MNFKLKGADLLIPVIYPCSPICINSLLLFFYFPPQYALVKDVISSLKRHRMHEQQFTHHPLLILNNFGVEGMHVKLMATMFQNMFPSINVHKVCPVYKAHRELGLCV